MDIKQLLKAITPKVYQNLKTAVEIGKWADGTALTDAQKESSIQAIMVYDATYHGGNDEPFRVQADGSVRLGKSATMDQVNSAANFADQTNTPSIQEIIIKSDSN